MIHVPGFRSIWSLLTRGRSGPPVFQRKAFGVANPRFVYISTWQILLLAAVAGTQSPSTVIGAEFLTFPYRFEAPRNEQGLVELGFNSGDYIIDDAILGKFAPDSEWNIAYDEKARQLREVGYATSFDLLLSEGGMTGYTHLDLPDQKAFFAYHYRALEAFRERLNALPPGPTNLVDDDFEEAVKLLTAFDEIHQMIREIPGPWPAPAGYHFDADKLEGLLAQRFFPGTVERSPQFAMKLEVSARWTPELGALFVPFTAPVSSAHEEIRQVAFEARYEGEAFPSSVRFYIESETPFRVLPGVAECGRIQQAGMTVVPVICEAPYVAGGVTVNLELSDPQFAPDEYQIYPQVSVILSATADEVEWQEVAARDWAMRFGRCDAEYRAGMESQGTRISDSRSLLYTLSSPASALPGARLYPGIQTNAFIDYAPGTDTTDFAPVEEAEAALVALIVGRLVDDELEQLVTEADSALSDLSFFTECSSEEVESLFLKLDDVLADIPDRRARFAALLRQANAASLHYQALVQAQLAEFDDDQIFETSEKTEGRQSAEMAASVVAGALVNVGVGVGIADNAAFLARFSARAGVLGSIMGTAQALSAAYDYAVLKLIEGNVEESIAWHEASAYFEGMVSRYDRIEGSLETVVSRLKQMHREACTCFNP